MYNIGLIVGGAEDPFSNQICKGAMEAASLKGDNLFIFPVKYLNRSDYAKEDPCQRFEYQYNFLIAYARSHSLDAIILCLSTIAYHTGHEECLALLKSFREVPVFLVASEEEGYASIKFNNVSGLRNGIEYLVKEKKCKNICMLSGGMNNGDAMERLQVYKDVLAENQIQVTDSMIEYGDLSEKSVPEMERLLANNPHMDAVVCANDVMAKAAYQVLKQNQLTIGEDVLVLGFDDIEESSHMEPPLATVRADAAKMGEQALIMAHESLEEYGSSRDKNVLCAKQSLVETAFVKRESVAGKGSNQNVFLPDKEYDYIRRIKEMNLANHQINIITRDMLMFDKGSENNFSGFLKAFSLDGVEECYLFLLEEPIEYHAKEYVNSVNNLYLQAYKRGTEIIEYSKGERVFNKDELFAFEGFKEHGKNYVVIDIYSREMQYGILVCDIPYRYFGYVENICFLISLATKIIDLLIMQEALLHEKEVMLQKLEQENLVLNNISNKDELTGIYNRRGFITKTLKLLREPDNFKKIAVLIYVDLNYLKLINDKYSHAEGNYALQACATALETVTGNDGAVGRIGGDEFAVFKIIPCPGEGVHLKNQLKFILDEMNNSSGKPYEIAVSAGTYEFMITAESDLKELIKEADSRLYMEKSHKRPFVER